MDYWIVIWSTVFISAVSNGAICLPWLDRNLLLVPHCDMGLSMATYLWGGYHLWSLMAVASAICLPPSSIARYWALASSSWQARWLGGSSISILADQVTGKLAARFYVLFIVALLLRKCSVWHYRNIFLVLVLLLGLY